MHSRPPNRQYEDAESSSLISPVSRRSLEGSGPYSSSSSREFRVVLDLMQSELGSGPRGPGRAWVEHMLQTITDSEYDPSVELSDFLLLYFPQLQKSAFTPEIPPKKEPYPEKEVILYPRVSSIRYSSKRPRRPTTPAPNPPSRPHCCRQTKTHLPPLVSNSKPLPSQSSPPKYFLQKSSSENSLELRFPRLYTFVREQRPSCSGVFSQKADDYSFPGHKNDSRPVDKISAALTAPYLFPSKTSNDDNLLRVSPPPTLRPASSSVKSLCERILSKHFPELRTKNH